MTGKTRGILVEGSKYGVVGGIGTLIDIALFNFVLWLSISVTSNPDPILAKTLSTIGSAGLTYLGHGFWTFRNRGGKRSSPTVMMKFGIVTALGLLISVVIVGLSHYVLGFQSLFANNVANLVALVTSALIRFIATRHWVFQGPRQDA